MGIRQLRDDLQQALTRLVLQMVEQVNYENDVVLVEAPPCKLDHVQALKGPVRPPTSPRCVSDVAFVDINPQVLAFRKARQMPGAAAWGFVALTSGARVRFDAMPPGTFSFRLNVPVTLEDGVKQANIPVDVAIMPKEQGRPLPMLVEAKSAGDFTNVNKRRKEG
jgi:hypothetical protein